MAPSASSSQVAAGRPEGRRQAGEENRREAQAGAHKPGGRHGADQISPAVQDGETTAGQEEEVRPGL